MGGSHRHFFNDDEENEEEDDDVYIYLAGMNPDERVDDRAACRASKASE